MEHQLKEEINDNLDTTITKEVSKNILGFDVINIKKHENETKLESKTVTAFDGVEEDESEKQNRKIKSEATENPHQCEVCYKEFKYRNSLINHARVHTGERPFECSKCGKKYTVKSSLNFHIQIHIKKITKSNRPYKCKVCNKRFGRKFVLTRHMRIHTGKEPYECAVCYRTFSLRHNMNNHMKTHKRDPLKPIPCEICHKSFPGTGALNLHINMHTRENVFKCSECDREFLQKHNFQRHLLTHKKEILKKIPQSSSGEIGMLSPGSMDEIKSEYKTIKSEKVDVTEIAKTEYADTEKAKPAIDGKVSSYLPYNSCFGDFICKEEVILPDEIEFD